MQAAEIVDDPAQPSERRVPWRALSQIAKNPFKPLARRRPADSSGGQQRPGVCVNPIDDALDSVAHFGLLKSR
jgi:hypothetical protein